MRFILSLWLLFSSPLVLAGSSSAISTLGSASQSQSALQAPAFQEPFSGEAVFQLVLSLGVVVGLILLIAWLLRRFSGITPAAKNMRVIGALSLGTREKAVLVQVGKKQLLLGVAPGRVNLLEAFDEPVVEVVENGTFSEKLSEVIQKRGRPDA